MDFDRALIIRKRWLDLILSGRKTWEMRTRHTTVRGRIGLIEAGSGLVVGTANLTDSLGPFSGEELRRHFAKHRLAFEMAGRAVQKWNHAWALEGARRLETPIPYTHPKGAVIWVRL